MAGTPMRGNMPMGVPMGMPMGVPMVGMQMGVPMMPMMPMANGMMPMAMNPMMSHMSQALEPHPEDAEKLNADKHRKWLVRELEMASENLANKAALIEGNMRSLEDNRLHRDGEGPSGNPDKSALPSLASLIAERTSAPAEEPAPQGKAQEPEKVEEKEVPRCHLHPQKKPNAKCKFCQRALAAQQARAESEAAASSAKVGGASASSGSSSAKASGGAKADEDRQKDYSKRSFNCSPMLKDQILGSSYFKSLLSITGIDELIEEISKYADSLDVANAGSNSSPSCFICQVYRIFTLPDAEDLLEVTAPFVDHTAPFVRCAGFVYMRFVVNPLHLFDKLEEFLFDTMELQYVENGKTVNTTIGEFVEGLLGQPRYFGTPLPRIPVKVQQKLEKELAPMWQYRKRMEANQREFRGKRIAGLPVEACIDGQWICGTAKEYTGRISQRRKAVIELEDNSVVSVHLGKVVLRDGKDRDGAKSDSDDDQEGNKRRRSRSRGKRRNAEPDWSRYKGRSETEMTQEFREKWREHALVSHGKSYAKRPFTMEEELWRREPEARVSMLGEDGAHGSGSRRESAADREAENSAIAARLKREDEMERQNRMRLIYEKYGSTSSAAKQTSAGSDIDKPDVLRLG
jgi:pre-mRNA-splicing factor 38B